MGAVFALSNERSIPRVGSNFVGMARKTKGGRFGGENGRETFKKGMEVGLYLFGSSDFGEVRAS